MELSNHLEDKKRIYRSRLREDCQLCLEQDGDTKRIVCVGYEGECSRCPDRTYAYIEETSETAYTRLSLHLAAY